MNRIRKGATLALCLLLIGSINIAIASAANYTVVKDDSLYKIGVLFNTQTNTIKSTNNLKSDVIYPGQVLNVPAKVHTVKSGDTLYLISKKNGISIASLRQANHKWDDLILPGQKLLLPSVAPASASASAKAKKTVIPYTDKEVDLLARLINAEAGGESYKAQVAVGAVVVNRVLSKEWPNTITEVINHVAGGYYQFTPVKNGFIKKPATTDSINAAWEALYGSDPSNHAMFYFDNTSTNEWLWSKPVTARIDNMIFAK